MNIPVTNGAATLIIGVIRDIRSFGNDDAVRGSAARCAYLFLNVPLRSSR